MSHLWNLPSEPGTIIAIGEWWLVRLRPYGNANSAWELLPMPTRELHDRAKSQGTAAQCIYGDDWVMSEAEQEGGYFIIAEPVRTPYGPHIRNKARS